MRRYVPYLAAALCAGILTLLSPATTEAGQFAGLAQTISASQQQSATLHQAGYYGGGDYYGDDKKSDDGGYGQKQEYDGGADGYDKGGYGAGGYYGSGGYDKGGYGGNGYYGSGGYDKGGYNDGGYGGGEKYDDNGGYKNGCCNGCYKKKWVCEESEPRCRSARECVWYYGKEYCRYVRRCYGGGDRYCKWVSYSSHNCGY